MYITVTHVLLSKLYRFYIIYYVNMYIWTIIENKHCKKKKKRDQNSWIDLEFLTLDSFSETVLGKIQRESESLPQIRSIT